MNGTNQSLREEYKGYFILQCWSGATAGLYKIEYPDGVVSPIGVASKKAAKTIIDTKVMADKIESRNGFR